MRPIFTLLIILCLCSCHRSSSKNYQAPDYEKMADRITIATAKKIQAETGLLLCGVGGGAIDHVNRLNMSFDCFKEITMEEGRKLLIYCINEYLSGINSNEEIRPFLIHYPFTPNDLEMRIFIHRADHRDVASGSLTVVSWANEKMKYKIRQPDPVVLKQIHTETYEEAVKILETTGLTDKVGRNLSVMKVNNIQEIRSIK